MMRRIIQSAVSFLNRKGWQAKHSRDQDGNDTADTFYNSDSFDPVRRSANEGFRRHLAGIFYADVADYTRLTEQDEEGTHLRLSEAIRIMMGKIAADHGRIAHIAGDAILAEFRNADSALHCAIEVQLSAWEWNAGLPSEQHVLFRIGVNFGDVISDHGDIYGNSVNLAARLEGLASSGGVCVSKSIEQTLTDKAPYRFIAMDRQYVKNVSEPVYAFRIELDAGQETVPGIHSSKKVSALAT
jgi:adenylate cyclase